MRHLGFLARTCSESLQADFLKAETDDSTTISQNPKQIPKVDEFLNLSSFSGTLGTGIRQFQVHRNPAFQCSCRATTTWATNYWFYRLDCWICGFLWSLDSRSTFLKKADTMMSSHACQVYQVYQWDPLFLRSITSHAALKRARACQAFRPEWRRWRESCLGIQQVSCQCCSPL